jgi:drug/metabolite transporter (DMT)-like permease
MSWLLEAVLGAIIIGTFVGLFKIPSYKGYQPLAVLTFCFLSSGIAAIILFHSYFALTTPGVILCAAVWGIAFSSMSALQMYALKYVDVGVLSPLTSALNLAGLSVLSVFILNERPSIYAWVGIVLVIIIIVLMRQTKSERAMADGTFASSAFTRKVILLCAGIVLINIGYSFFLKYEVTHFSIEAIQLYQYFFAALATLGYAFLGKTKLREVFAKDLRPSVGWGMVLGTLSACGGYLYYLSVQHGPFALANAVGALYIVVVVLVAALFFKEKLTLKRLVLVILAVAAVLLMQFS